MTQDKLSNPFDPLPGTVYAELLPDVQEIDLPIPVRKIFRTIRDHPKLTKEFKIEWLKAIASIFKEEIIFSEKPLDSKLTGAKTRLSEAINFRTQEDHEHYDTETENERILAEFEEWLRREYIRRHIIFD